MIEFEERVISVCGLSREISEKLCEFCLNALARFNPDTGGIGAGKRWLAYT